MPPRSEPQLDVSTDRERRLSFGSVAEQYDRHRPSYPQEMVDVILEYSGLRPGERVLDVGAGTGKATRLFAARGFAVTAIEPDPGMAAVASKQAATAGQSIEILSTDFERAELPEGAYALLISGTAWHWVSPGGRNRLAARALRPGGTLAPFWNRPQWQGNPLRRGFEAAYARLGEQFAARPGGVMNPYGAPPQIRDDREWLEQEFRGSSDFVDVDARVFDWYERYATAEYLALLGTHSDHILLAQPARERLLAEIAAVIDGAGGSFELRYQTLLCLARRRTT